MTVLKLRLNQGSALTLALSGPPVAVAAFRQSALLKALQCGKGAWARSIRTQYETPDRRLAVLGFALELEESPAGRIQTISRLNEFQGILGQNEVATTLERTGRFPVETGILEFDCPINELRPSLAPLSRVTTDRWPVNLDYRGASIRCVFRFSTLDQWDAKGARRSAPKASIMLTLTKGPAKAFYDVARMAVREAALYPDYTGPAYVGERRRAAGFDAAETIAPIPRLLLESEDSAGEVLREAMRIIAERLIALRPAIVERRDGRALQQLRVALRRLRVMERIYRPYLIDMTLNRLAKRARRIMRRLGPARDWDVFLASTLPAAALRWAGEGRRAEAWDEAFRVVSGNGFARFSLDLFEAAHCAPWLPRASPVLAAPVGPFARAALDARLDDVLRVAAGMDRTSLQARHPLRISLKKLRYAAQTFRALYPKIIRKPFMSELSRLQDAFGDINDTVSAVRLADLASRGEGDEAVRAAGFLYGAQALQAAAAIDEAWLAFEKRTPFWRG